MSERFYPIAESKGFRYKRRANDLLRRLRDAQTTVLAARAAGSMTPGEPGDGTERRRFYDAVDLLREYGVKADDKLEVRPGRLFHYRIGRDPQS